MRLVVDTSVLVGELLRERGRRRLADQRVELYLPEQMWREAMHEIPRRVLSYGRSRGLTADDVAALSESSREAIAHTCSVVAEDIYKAWEDEARWRSARDQSDWPAVACALALDAAVWTNDNDFLGTGVPTWTTETLDLWLQRTESDG